jgi:hypothetical protein
MVMSVAVNNATIKLFMGKTPLVGNSMGISYLKFAHDFKYCSPTAFLRSMGNVTFVRNLDKDFAGCPFIRIKGKAL